MLIERVRKMTWRSWLLIGSVFVGVYFDIHTQSLISCVLLILVFVFFVNIPVAIVGLVFSEQRPVPRVLFSVASLCIIPISLFVSFEHVNNEPFAIENSPRGPYPVWYVNPITHKCSYRLQKVVSEIPHYWYSAGECSQEDKDRIFQEDYDIFSSIDLSPGTPNSIAEQCFDLGFDYMYKINQKNPRRTSMGNALDSGVCYGLSGETKGCKDYRKKEEYELRTELKVQKEGLLRDFLKQTSNLPWGVSAEVFAKLCPNHGVFDYFLSSDAAVEDADPTEGGIVSQIWSPDPRPISKILEIQQEIFLSCRKNGGIIRSNSTGIGTDQCEGQHKILFKWVGSLRCGDDSVDTQYVVRDGDNDKWNFTINCKNMVACNGPSNALCDKDGCRFSQECLDSN